MIKRVVMVAALGCALVGTASAGTDAEDLVLRGDILMAKSDCASAMVMYEAALAIEPSNAAVHNKIGICQQRAERLASGS